MSFFGKKLDAPILIEGMTGGTTEAKIVNTRIAKVAKKFGLAMGVGSQKAMILNPRAAVSYEVKKFAPDILLFGNIGIDYLLSKEFSLNALQKAISDIGADGLFIHLNVMHELAQEEGESDFRGALKMIEKVVQEMSVPVLVKEVGAGVDPETAKKLEEIGIAVIDVGGAGGTSWPAVEGYRGSFHGENLRDWGLPTVADLVLVRKAVKIPVIASGGVRTGLDIAKSIALGASLAGLALPIIRKAVVSEVLLENEVEKLIEELKMAMLGVGVKDVGELEKVNAVVKGESKQIIDQASTHD